MHPGRYTEGLIIDRPVEVVGIGRREDVVIESKHVSCIVMKTDESIVVRGITLRYVLNEDELDEDVMGWHYADETPVVLANCGRLLLEDCAITGFLEGIHLNHQANAIIRGCSLDYVNLRVDWGARAVVEDCDVSAHATHLRPRQQLGGSYQALRHS